MRLGEVVGGYRITTQPTNAGGGKCMWAFAEKDGAGSGEEYFVKQFLAPKLPRPGGGGSERSRLARLRLCEEFEERHRSIMGRLKPDVHGAGHLVLATDFFAHGSTYYKVTARIDTSTLEKPQLLEPRHKAVLLKTLAVSLNLLHGIDVVHGDLKPANVLVQQYGGNAFHVAKLIDFDDSYLSGSPPGRDDIAGDSLYGAPEWRRYVQGDESVQPRQLTTAVDIFALGLMTHHYLTGALPRHDDRFGSPADAVNARADLWLDPRLTDPMQNLLRRMLSRAPSQRPRASGVISALKDPNVCALQHRRPGTAGGTSGTTSGGAGGKWADSRRPEATGAPGADSAPDGPPRTGPHRASRLRTNVTGSPRPRTTTDEPATTGPPASGTPAADAPRVSRVRINLGDRRTAAPRTKPTGAPRPWDNRNDQEDTTT
ncbi:protein kinase domain-containing protein [Streptomyces murinus]|uniref:protein kinase domain-containing protein n=1 Tax=Streptomyces murinus TaxID=33900 RepID=UPI003F48F83E